tara:strand:- start:1 stop:117 length:117 start_codon:yes stop_codon:yes gene_type:complete
MMGELLARDGRLWLEIDPYRFDEGAFPDDAQLLASRAR